MHGQQNIKIWESTCQFITPKKCTFDIYNLSIAFN